jgi:hypothetical protein
VRRLLLLVPAAALVAACGSSGSKPYVPSTTAKCLKQHQYTVKTNDPHLSLVFQTAANGGLVATPPGGGNVLEIGFGTDAADAAKLQSGIRRVAPKKLRPHLGDIMTTKRNAVLLWTVSPTPAQQQTVLGCLGS